MTNSGASKAPPATMCLAAYFASAIYDSQIIAWSSLAPPSDDLVNIVGIIPNSVVTVGEDPIYPSRAHQSDCGVPFEGSHFEAFWQPPEKGTPKGY